MCVCVCVCGTVCVNSECMDGLHIEWGALKEGVITMQATTHNCFQYAAGLHTVECWGIKSCALI